MKVESPKARTVELDCRRRGPTIQQQLLALLESAEHRGLSNVVLTADPSTFEGWLSARFYVLRIGLDVLFTDGRKSN